MSNSEDLDTTLMALSRCSQELSAARQMARYHDAEVDRLREYIRRIHYLAGNEVIRNLCEEALLGEIPD